MSLRTHLLLAALFAIVVLADPGSYKAELDVPHPHTFLRMSAAAAALPLYASSPANLPGQNPYPFLDNNEPPSAAFLPVQFKNPRILSVGKLLVAKRGIGDPRFARTVILLVNYDENGVIGLVLNRRTALPISQVLNLKAAKDRSDPIYLGGPVEPSVAFALYRSPVSLKSKLKKAKNIFGHVYLISDRDLFEKTMLAHPNPKDFRVYLGYAGWTQSQLQAEVQLGQWFVFPADPAAVFNSDPGSLWLHLIQKTELRLTKANPFAATPQSGLELLPPEQANAQMKPATGGHHDNPGS